MIGKTLAQYEIVAPLGEGGMGVVYRATDRRLQREVALKLLHEHVAGVGQERERILAEARAASPLNHPSVATIYEVGEHDGRLFIVMELVRGKTLRERMNDGSLRPREIPRLGMQIAEPLEIAHARSIVHGDIKPENVVLQEDGRLKLLDFGVAHRTAGNSATTTITDEPASGPNRDQLAGTYAYMAPERLRGEWSDPRSDLFSLGILLYEMVAGRRPFPGPDPGRYAAQILDHPVPPIDTSITDAPAELVRIIHKLLEKDPESRYQSARDVRVDLTNLQRDLETGATLSASVAGRRAVAVLPFRLLTPDREDEYLGVAISDALINGLSVSDQLLLRPMSSVMSYSRMDVDPLIAARELNVQVIVEGSIQKLGRQLRAHVQVWDAENGATLLSVKHDAETSDLFGLQDRIAETVYATLGVATDGPDEPPTNNPRAYELYLRAVDRLSHGNQWDTRTAIEMLRTVTGLDPKFADAWARLAQGCIMMAWFYEPGADWFSASDEAIERALHLDPDNVEARVAKGRSLWSPPQGYPNSEALRVLGEALQLNPNSHQARLWQALILLHVGLLDEAHQGLTETLARQPDDPFALTFLGQTLEFQGDYERAENLFLPAAMIRKGELDRAEVSIRTAGQILGEDQMLLSSEAIIWAQRGDASRAEALAQKALNDAKTLSHTHHSWHNVAAVYGLLGKPDEAVRWLDQAARMGLPNFPLFRDDPLLDPLRGHAGFDRLMSDLRRDWNGFRAEFGG